ncbi:MAG: pyridoxal-phosphate dependent enzyme, partial [Pyrinomonadaceae bacterium]
TVDLIDVTKVSRNDRVAQLKAQMPDAYFASPYDDKFVIDGNSTLGDEIAVHDFDAVIVPVGGGGMISGVISSFCRNGKQTPVYGAEPQLGNDAARSLAAGEIVANETEPMTIADGARTLQLGKLNWEIIKEGTAGIIEVPDELTANALRLYFGLVNLKSEPTGALSLGAVLADQERFRGQKICVVVSGGNVDAGVYARIISEG